MSKSFLRNPAIAADVVVALVLVAAFVTAATNYPLRASILIYLVCVAGFMLACLDVVVRVRNIRMVSAGGEVAARREIRDTRDVEDDRPAAERRRSAIDTWAWYFAMLLAVWLVGMEIGIPLAALLYSKLHGGTWFGSILIAVLLGVVIVVVFSNLMGIPWPQPVLPL